MSRLSTHRSFVSALLLLFGLPGLGFAAEDGVRLQRGQLIYKQQCVECHGAQGEGVADEYDEPLTGDRSIADLAKIIHKTMPDGSEEDCVDDDAAMVAEYIHQAFYSSGARMRNQPVKVDLVRLTVPQYLNAVADLVGSFRKDVTIDDSRGLEANHYGSRNMRRDKHAIERIDPEVDFAFGAGSPGEKMEAEEFSIKWEGSVIIEETGEYEFCVATENGARLWVNDMETKLIDAWVSSGKSREERASVRLLGGRAYPVRLEFFKFKDKTASVALRWTPPHQVEQVIPQRHLSPKEAATVLVINRAFPPDDASVGYERGSSVSKAWDTAATYAAIEVANHVLDHLLPLAGVDRKDDDEARRSKARKFCAQFVRRAFRRPLSEEQERFFVDGPLTDAPDLENGVKRCVLLTLKSPRFLYVGMQRETPDAHDVAMQISTALWDSVPDKELQTAAQNQALLHAQSIRNQTQRMLSDPRTKAKVSAFFSHWLELDEAEDITKDPKRFPDFNERTIADMRTSLELFLDEVVWGESSDYRQLLLADYLYLNGSLAEFFGLDTSGDDSFKPYQFDPRERSGVVTHPLVLTAFAYHASTSPIHRGVFLTRNVLGRSLKPPPMAIEFMDGKFDPRLTMREKVAELTKSKACMTCHEMINPLGFSLEHFDAVGRVQFEDKNKPINASGVYRTLAGDEVPLEGPRDLAEHAATSVTAQRSFIEQLFHHMIKQPVNAYGPETLNKLHQSFVESDYHIQHLLVEIVRVAAMHRLSPTSQTAQL
mgnify:CR=1 FL=1